jgi:hypothetical protein
MSALADPTYRPNIAATVTNVLTRTSLPQSTLTMNEQDRLQGRPNALTRARTAAARNIARQEEQRRLSAAIMGTSKRGGTRRTRTRRHRRSKRGTRRH